MNGKSMHWVNRLAALGLVVGLVAGLAAVGSAQSVGGQAYSTYVNTPLGSSAQSPLAVLPAVSGTDGAEADAEGDAMSVAGALSSDFLNSITSGEIGAAEAGAHSTPRAAGGENPEGADPAGGGGGQRLRSGGPKRGVR